MKEKTKTIIKMASMNFYFLGFVGSCGYGIFTNADNYKYLGVFSLFVMVLLSLLNINRDKWEDIVDVIDESLKEDEK